MAKRRSKVFETKYFGFVIGLIVVGFFFGFSRASFLLGDLELKVLDMHLFINTFFSPKVVSEGVHSEAQNPHRSPDITILGIDSSTLSEYGRFPFPRYRYADLVNSFSRISDQAKRERSIFVDVLFVEPDSNATDDALLVSSMRDSGRVFMETVNSQYFSTSIDEDEYWKRLETLQQRDGSFGKISGPWQDMLYFGGFEAPLQPISAQVKGFGFANFEKDYDSIYRRQALIEKVSRLLDLIPLESLSPGYSVDSSAYERLCWMDKEGAFHNIPTPLTAAQISRLKAILPKESPPKEEDVDGDGKPDKTTFVVRRYREYFEPSITLALALDYFNKKLSDLDVRIGKYVRIPSPQKWESAEGKWVPYYVQVTPDVYDDDGNLVKAGTRRNVPEITIPIDGNGQMLINYLGPRSSAEIEGNQTYPIQAMSAWADRVSPPDPNLWPKQRMADNKILLVGAFANGMAQDEKPTPFGLMYGVEIHANALNTILMQNFISYAASWQNLAILLACVMIICFLSSRMPTIPGFFLSLLLMVGLFVGCNLSFAHFGIFFDFATPALAMFFTFMAVIVYRAMTEEKDKRALRETFGKYVSPKVVDQLVQDPPELGGVDKDLTVFFSDIRGFSTLSENMSPQELVNHLNVYLAAMTDIILEYGGTLDKYIGDAIMAFWGAPLPQADHARRACECALKQMLKLRELNASWPPEKRINIGIGINSGIMTVGNMGSKLRMNYTLMGDNVNLGSRLEGTNKEYGTNIIVSEYTYALVRDKFVFRELDNVRVKGKNKPVGIYELIDVIESDAEQTEK